MVQLQGGVPTPVMAKLKKEIRKQLDEKLDDGKKARLKVNATLTDTSDATDGAKLKVKLTG